MQKRLPSPRNDGDPLPRPHAPARNEAPRGGPGRPLTPAVLAHVQLVAGNRAASMLVVQRHAMEAPAVALDEVEEVSVSVQRVLSDQQLRTATGKVRSAISAATSVRKTLNPVLYNTGKALTKGGITWSVRDQQGKAWVAGAQPNHVNLGGDYVLGEPQRGIQGALAHEVGHILTAGTGLDIFQDEFNAYFKEITANTGGGPNTPTQLASKLAAVRRALGGYGWWTVASPAQQQAWLQVAAASGFNQSNSWKQKKLLDLMAETKPVATVVSHVRSMNEIDRNEAREAQRDNGTYYLAYGNYAGADKTRIWTALGGAAGAVPA